MRFLRADNPEIAMSLIPWFVPANQNPIQMGWELHERLRDKPKDTFCLIALEKRIIQGIMIAYKEKRHIWIWQAHTRDGFKYAKVAFEGLKNWAQSINRNKIRMGATEKYKAFQRRWGFKPCRWDKSVMELKI